MQTAAEPWPPSRQQFFREPTPGRPIFQGDVFRDVPAITGQAGDRFEADPRIRVERRMVVALTYPCEMYARGVLARVQTVAVAREASKLATGDLWTGGFGACPLPDLLGDGALWAVDFRAICSVDRSYLRVSNRLACLTELGWAYLRQRLTLYFARTPSHLDDLRQTGRATWDETELWEQWSALGRDPSAFPAWLDQLDPMIGFTRRQALERGMLRLVASTLLGAS